MGRRVGNNPYISKTLISDPYKIIEDVVGEERLWKQHRRERSGRRRSGKDYRVLHRRWIDRNSENKREDRKESIWGLKNKRSWSFETALKSSSFLFSTSSTKPSTYWAAAYFRLSNPPTLSFSSPAFPYLAFLFCIIHLLYHILFNIIVYTKVRILWIQLIGQICVVIHQHAM